MERASHVHVCCLSLLVAVAGTFWIPAAADDSPSAQQHWVDTASRGLDPAALDALHRINGANRRLLALRAYLRAGEALAARWSWSQERLSHYPATPEGRAATADIDAVLAAFARANPGYTLQVNRQPRSLETQLAHWNENGSVAAVADSLVQYLETHLGGASSASSAQLRAALVQWTPRTAAPLAAPGLSAHGQGRAYDFAVVQRGRIVAGLDAASAHAHWDAAGWSRALASAVAASGKPFVGPLQSPYEPWHYAYMPR